MKLSIEYLNQRHAYWINRIGDKGIWNPLCFCPLTLVIKKDCKSYNGMFQRRIKIKMGKKEITDKIIIYNKVDDFDPKFLDSVLVHEMIHQYIIQNEIKDTRTHGKIFRGYMNRINENFKGELQISVRDRNPGVPQKGPGEKTHKLLLLQYKDDKWFLAVINPSKVTFFEDLIKRYGRSWSVKSHYWTESNDVHFNNYRRCTRTLHGLKKSRSEMIEFCKEFGVRI